MSDLAQVRLRGIEKVFPLPGQSGGSVHALGPIDLELHRGVRLSQRLQQFAITCIHIGVAEGRDTQRSRHRRPGSAASAVVGHPERQ